jgi:hypothetical protein
MLLCGIEVFAQDILKAASEATDELDERDVFAGQIYYYHMQAITTLRGR